VGREALKQLEQKLGEIPKRLQRLKKSGCKKLSRTDEDSRFLRQRQGYVLGYTGTVAVSEDYLIVGQQVSQAGERDGDGRTGDRCVCAGFAPGARVESRAAGAGARSDARSGATANETKAALCCRPGDVRETKRNRGTQDRNVERATRDAAVSDARLGKSGRGVHAGEHSVESDAHVAQGSHSVGAEPSTTTQIRRAIAEFDKKSAPKCIRTRKLRALPHKLFSLCALSPCKN